MKKFIFDTSFSFFFSVCVSLRAFEPGVQRCFSRNIGIIRLFYFFLAGTCENRQVLINTTLTFGPLNLKEAVKGVNRCLPAFSVFFGRLSECWRQCEPNSDEKHNEQKRVSPTPPSHFSRSRPTAMKFG